MIDESPTMKIAREQLENSYKRAETLASMKHSRHVYKKELQQLDNARKRMILASNLRAHGAKFDSTGILLQSLTPRTTTECIDHALKSAAAQGGASHTQEDLFQLAAMYEHGQQQRVTAATSCSSGDHISSSLAVSNAATAMQRGRTADKAHTTKAIVDHVNNHIVDPVHDIDFV